MVCHWKVTSCRETVVANSLNVKYWVYSMWLFTVLSSTLLFLLAIKTDLACWIATLISVKQWLRIFVIATTNKFILVIFSISETLLSFCNDFNRVRGPPQLKWRHFFLWLNTTIHLFFINHSSMHKRRILQNLTTNTTRFFQSFFR